MAPDTTPVTLQTAVPAWTYGAYSLDFIPAGATTQKFAIVGCGFAQPDTNGDYTVEFTYGIADAIAAVIGFNRFAVLRLLSGDR